MKLLFLESRFLTNKMKKHWKKVFENLKTDRFAILFTICMIICFMTAGSGLLKQDFGEFFKWWLVVLVSGISCMPLCASLFGSFSGRGWLFSKTIGIALSGWLIWMFSSIKLFRFNTLGCYTALFIVLLINFVLLYLSKRGKLNKSKEYADSYLSFSVTEENIKHMLISELVFIALFIFWTYLKGFAPDAHGTEKQMDYGFMQALMKSEYMPPEDLWLSGFSLNYYYVGQFFAVYLTKLSGVGCEYGYNLMLMMIASFAYCLPASLIYNVAKDHANSRYENRSHTAVEFFSILSGNLAGIAVLFAGNMHYVIKCVLAPIFRSLLGIDKMAEATGYTFSNYWFPDATRYIGYDPDTADKTIHEFPLYSVVLGDLHAHVINIIFVITVLAILYTYLRNRKERYRIFCPQVLLTGFFIGLFHTTNYWDFPIYFVVAGAVILFTNLIIYRFKIKAWYITACQAAVVIITSKLISLPFSLSFNQISSEIAKCEDHSPIYQLLVLWGLPIICMFVYLVSLIKEQVQRTQQVSIAFEKDNLRIRPLARFIRDMEGSDLFVLTIMLCAAGLILLPELIYVKDIYTGDFKRANTMFKLTYQAFIMFGIGMGYIFIRGLFFEADKRVRRFAVIGVVLLLWTTGYFGVATNSWFGNWKNTSGYRGIKCDEYMKNINLQDYDAINWINSNIEGRPVMLEVNGDSYTDYCRVSVLTGLPTLLGWRTHEWLWQSDGSGDYPEIMTERRTMIETVYTSEDLAFVSNVIRDNSIEYIYVGDCERNDFLNLLNHEMILSLGDVVYPADFNMGDEYSKTYIVKIDQTRLSDDD